MNTAGSNYLVHDLGDYANITPSSTKDERDAAWYGANGVQSVVGTYQNNRARIHTQIKDMYANGQREISLPLTFANAFGGKQVHGHILLLDPDDYTVRPEHLSNLKSIVQYIGSIGYNRLTIRIGYWNMTAPFAEDDYAAFYRYKALVFAVHAAIDEVRGNLAVRYDLGMEKGGLDDANNHQYVYWMWRHYVNKFGADDTVGFSVSSGGNPTLLSQRLTKLWTEQYGDVKPPVQAIDVYTSVTDVLNAAAGVIGQRGIVIQETYYDDYRNWHEARMSNANLIAMYQWPLERSANVPHLSVAYTPRYRYADVEDIVSDHEQRIRAVEAQIT